MIPINELCTLDDSTWRLKSKNEKPDILFYSHALYIPHENLLTYISFISFKSKKNFKTFSKEIFDFVNQKKKGYKLIACQHYQMYPVLERLIYDYSNRHLRKENQAYLRTYFNKSDVFSRKISQNGRDFLLKRKNFKNFLKKLKSEKNTFKLFLEGYKYNTINFNKSISIEDYL